MFGKRKMSTNDSAIMAMGRANGNLKSLKEKSAFGVSGVGVSRGSKGGKKGEETPNPFNRKDMSLGSAGPVKLVKG